MAGSTHPKKRKRGFWLRWTILSLVLGAASIALISRTDKQEKEITIATVVIKLAENLAIADASKPMVRLTVSGSSAVLRNVDPKSIHYSLDLSGLGKGMHTVRLHPENVILPDGVVLSKLETPSLTITLEPLPASKNVDVVAVLEGKAAPGFAVATVALEPDRIVIKGPAAMVEKIETVKTQAIQLEAASESFKKEVPLVIPEATTVIPSTRIVVAHVHVRERVVNRLLEDVPVVGRGMDGKYRIHPETIDLTVVGPEAVVKTIEADAAFAVSIDLTGLDPGIHRLRAAIHLPVRVKLMSANPELFEVNITAQ